MLVIYQETTGRYPDGTQYSLRRPIYGIEEVVFGPLQPVVQISPRVAPATIGMGLLEAIPESRILDLADVDDANSDGISRRPNYVRDFRKGELALGRFGWKANQPTVEQQAAGAFLGDIGITSTIFPDDNCTSAQEECRLGRQRWLTGDTRRTSCQGDHLRSDSSCAGNARRRGRLGAGGGHANSFKRSARSTTRRATRPETSTRWNLSTTR